MLQQTQVARVIPRFLEVMERSRPRRRARRRPPATCSGCGAASATTGAPSGLHAAAGAVERDFGGVFPRTIAELQHLPGVGPYTARAIMAFAFEADVAVVDTNVARTWARWSGRPLRPGEVQALADAAVPEGEGWAWNQSLLDLGATVCRARGPQCGAARGRGRARGRRPDARRPILRRGRHTPAGRSRPSWAPTARGGVAWSAPSDEVRSARPT